MTVNEVFGQVGPLLPSHSSLSDPDVENVQWRLDRAELPSLTESLVPSKADAKFFVLVFHLFFVQGGKASTPATTCGGQTQAVAYRVPFSEQQRLRPPHST